MIFKTTIKWAVCTFIVVLVIEVDYKIESYEASIPVSHPASVAYSH